MILARLRIFGHGMPRAHGHISRSYAHNATAFQTILPEEPAMCAEYVQKNQPAKGMNDTDVSINGVVG